MFATVDYADLVGVPFAYGGRGPDFYDCYGLLMELYRRRGVTLPEQTSPTSQEIISAKMGIELLAWTPCEKQPGAGALFRVGRLISHCGMVVDQNHMVHAWEKCGGVTVERLETWTRRLVGYYQYTGSKRST